MPSGIRSVKAPVFDPSKVAPQLKNHPVCKVCNQQIMCVPLLFGDIMLWTVLWFSLQCFSVECSLKLWVSHITLNVSSVRHVVKISRIKVGSMASFMRDVKWGIRRWSSKLRFWYWSLVVLIDINLPCKLLSMLGFMEMNFVFMLERWYLWKIFCQMFIVYYPFHIRIHCPQICYPLSIISICWLS